MNVSCGCCVFSCFFFKQKMAYEMRISDWSSDVCSSVFARAKAQMDEESTGVRDEIGFLTIHQGYADLFFPGTSVLHTRARYLLFVPWLFEDLAPATGPVAQRALQEKERVLAGR